MLETALEEEGVRDLFEVRYNVPFTEMQAVMAASAVGFVLYPTDVNYGARIPIRIFEYMASGLPFVASDLPTTAAFTRGRGVAELVPPGSPGLRRRARGAVGRPRAAGVHECARPGPGPRGVQLAARVAQARRPLPVAGRPAVSEGLV